MDGSFWVLPKLDFFVSSMMDAMAFCICDQGLMEAFGCRASPYITLWLSSLDVRLLRV